MYELNTSWVLWYHSIKDTSWTKSSYKQMFTFTNIYDYSIFEGPRGVIRNSEEQAEYLSEFCS